ncbi:MAG: hypothetical protein HKN71_06355 [Gemmatimonadetes bacterium]|nr:hypothetical protein [Gemmatimonadota bacterium]
MADEAREIRRIESDGEVGRMLEVSELRDEVEVLEQRVSRTFHAGVAISAAFAVSGAFMEQAGTLWFLGAIWLLVTSRLVMINRASAGELRIKEATMESLLGPGRDLELEG